MATKVPTLDAGLVGKKDAMTATRTDIISHGGRPVKTEHERRTKHAFFSFTPAELKHLAACADPATVPDFIRQIALQPAGDFRPAQGRQALPAGATRKNIRVTVAENENLKTLAKNAGLSIASFIRLAVLHQVAFNADVGLVQLDLAPDVTRRLTRQAIKRGMSLNEYLIHQAEARSTGGRTAAPTADLVMNLDKMVGEMNRIGVNFNQLTHSANTGRTLHNLLQQRMDEMATTQAQAEELLKQVASHYVA